MLLSHSGGLQREAPLDMWESMRGPSAHELVAAFADVELIAAVGARWHYSNLGYGVLGHIVELVAGRPCADLIDSLLIHPLGLGDTSWSRPSNGAVGYRSDPYADIVHREPDMDQKALGVGGQLWTTAADLLVWGNALAGGAPEVLPEEVPRFVPRSNR